MVFVPADARLTAHARAALPASVPHARRRLQRRPVGTAGARPDHAPELLLAATEDRLHQQYRAAGHAGDRRDWSPTCAGGVPAFVSGAGPSVLALRRVGRALPDPRPGGGARSLSCSSTGARIVLLDTPRATLLPQVH